MENQQEQVNDNKDQPATTQQEGKKTPAANDVAPDPFQPKGPRDGYDNTGTQGYDSLKDDGYTGSSPKDTDSNTEDGTGS